jgi:hypothetical protein
MILQELASKFDQLLFFIINIMFTERLSLASLVCLAAASGTFSYHLSPHTTSHVHKQILLPTAVYATPAPTAPAPAVPASSPTTTQIFTVAVPNGLGPDNAIFNAAVLGRDAAGVVTIRYDLAEDVLEAGKDRNLSFSLRLLPVAFTLLTLINSDGYDLPLLRNRSSRR